MIFSVILIPEQSDKIDSKIMKESWIIQVFIESEAVFIESQSGGLAAFLIDGLKVKFQSGFMAAAERHRNG